MTDGDSPLRIVFASRNAGKLGELRRLCATLPVELLDLDQAGVPLSAVEDTIEVHETFAENARAKARYFRALVGKLPVVAEDSGLEVFALNGAPGVRSRRFSQVVGTVREVDAANNALLLDRLAGVRERGARFVCAVHFMSDARESAAEGTVSGRIVESPVGSGGFGYDALFWSPELGCTFAEVSAELKTLVSHRGRAFATLLADIGLTRATGEDKIPPANGA